MKKTIAILLVLVLAGVGLFAAPIDNTLTIHTTIAAINKMIITAHTVTPTGAGDALWTGGNLAFEYGTVAVPILTVGGASSHIANIHTMSNSRSGYIVTMLAGPLTNGTGGTGGVEAHLAYTVSTNKLADGTAGSVTSVRAVAGDRLSSTVTPTTATTIITQGATTTTIIDKREISVAIGADSLAVASDYTGVITFSFTAN